MNGTASNIVATLVPRHPNRAITNIADLIGDRKADILDRHTDGSIVVWLINGTTLGSGEGLSGPGTLREGPWLGET